MFVKGSETSLTTTFRIQIGFDADDQVRLFDFGLCREFDSSLDVNSLTLCVGCPRYMAPEVASGRLYDFSADVHSFAILLWEICTLDKPFSKSQSVKQLFEIYAMRKQRPSLFKVGSKRIRELLKTCWDPNPQARPSMPLVLNALENLQ